MKAFEMKIKDGEHKLYDISLVDKPATENNFIKLSKDAVKFASNDKQELTGVVLIPNQMIYRNNGVEEFEIFMSAETIKELSIIHMANNNQNNVTLNHNDELINDVVMFESWIVEDSKNDKSNALGLGELPRGTWLTTMKVNNVELWEQIKEGDFNGFSITAKLEPELVEMSAEDKIKQILDILG